MSLSPFEFWLMVSILSILGGGLTWLFRTFGVKVLDKLDQVVESNNNVSDQIIVQSGQIKSLEQRVDTHDERINKHGERIRSVEIEIAKKGK